MALISLLHPSRGRPEKSLSTASEWVDKCGAPVELVLSLDRSDPMYKQYDKGYCNFEVCVKEYENNQNFINYTEICNDNTCVVQATNHAAMAAKGDILVYLSDDFKCPDNWGQLIIKEFEGPTGPRLIKVDDCLQKFDVPVLTIPIMNRALYERLSYFWHPEYRSMHVDVDLYETVKRLGALKLCPHLKFPHEHVSIGKAPMDETYRRSSANWDQGLEVINRRRKLNFPA